MGMRCLADFILDSDLCLADGTGPLTLHSPDGDLSLVMANASADERAPNAVLSAQLIFETDTLDETTWAHASDKLAEFLNCLSYTTNRKFVRNRLKRVIDWTPGIIERRAIIYVETPEWDLAEPKLDNGFVNSAA